MEANERLHLTRVKLLNNYFPRKESILRKHFPSTQSRKDNEKHTILLALYVKGRIVGNYCVKAVQKPCPVMSATANPYELCALSENTWQSRFPNSKLESIK